MRWLNGSEEGAVAVTVTVVLVVLIGLTSIVVDAGGLFYERRQLQNGADAAALAIAYDCAGGDCGTPADTAEGLTLANNVNGGNVENITAVTPATGQVTVGVRSGESDGSPGTVRNIFHAASTALLGTVSGDEESIVQAQATAIWGGVGLGNAVFPLSMSLCTFMGGPGPYTLDELDAMAATLPTEADLPRNAAGVVSPGPVISKLHTPGDPDACTVKPGFAAEGESKMPAGFGWLEISSACQVNVTSVEPDGQFWAPRRGGTYPDGRDCLSAQFRKAAEVPLWTGFRSAPVNEYRLYAPAAFYLTSIKIPPGANQGPAIPGCGGPDWCVQGHFVKKVVADAPIGGGPSLGVNAVALTN
jgi:hypothetical protein